MDEPADPQAPQAARCDAVAGRPKRHARPWHRVVGMLCAVPLLWVVITGALLNHTVDWRLDQRMVDHPWVMAAYGMNPAGEPRGLSAGGHRVVQWDGQLFVDGQRVSLSGDLLGAVADGDGLAVVTTEQVLRLDGEGRQIELLGSASLPALPLTGVARAGERVFLGHGGGWHEVMDDWLDFREEGEPRAAQALAVVAKGGERELLRRAWSEGGLPLSRILLDLHAGHFLGSFGRYFYDLVAVATVLLCVTGGILFFRTPRRNR